MLLRLGVPIGYVWHQAGLIYQEKEPGIAQIGAYYQDVTENDHGVKWTTEYYDDLGLYIERLHALLETGHTVALAVDIYELPYAMYYRHHHEAHGIEVLRAEEGHLVIADHFYHYFGPIEVDILKKSVEVHSIHISPGMTTLANRTHLTLVPYIRNI